MNGTRAPLGPAIVTRGIALWILAGAMAKLFLATPADLPRLARDVPLDLALTFRLLIAVETFVAVLALFRPKRAWPLEALVLLAFVAALVVQVSEGARSCGCFGATISVPPGLMLGVDAALLVLLLLSRPWRLPATRLRRDLGFAAVALVLAVLGPIAFDREGTGAGTLRSWQRLDVDSWVGKTVGETSLATWIDVAETADGLWFFYRESCEVCADCLDKLTREEQGQRDLTLVRVGEKHDADFHKAVHRMPEGGFVHRFDLPDTIDWVVTTPSDMVVENGRIVSVRHGIEPEACR